MNTIKTYLDNVFAAFPQTERVLGLKRDMLAGMEEKYQSLRQHGMNEHEAVGTVITNFGSIDEIRLELGITSEPASIVNAPASLGASETANPNVHAMTHRETMIYLADIQHYGVWVGAALAMIFFGVASLMFFDGGARYFLGTALITGALVLFIGKTVNFYSIHKKHFEPHSGGVHIDAQTRIDVEESYAGFKDRNRRRRIIGGVSVLLAVWFFIMGSTAAGNSDLANPLALVGIGIAVHSFVSGSIGKVNYDYVLGKWSGGF